MPLTPASELLLRYAIFGAFYNIDDGLVPVKCRNVLEIVRIGTAVEASMIPDVTELYTYPADAIFIMMNPGSSEPRPAGHEQYSGPPAYLFDANLPDRILSTSLVRTKPDNTQYQLMRIMDHYAWDHVRVLNLSDLREAKSGVFIQVTKNGSELCQSYIHSIFAAARTVERDRAFYRKVNAPIIKAWGTNKGLQALADLCSQQLPRQHCFGLGHKNGPLFYRHPLPSLVSAQQVWLFDMLQAMTAQNQQLAGVGN